MYIAHRITDNSCPRNQTLDMRAMRAPSKTQECADEAAGTRTLKMPGAISPIPLQSLGWKCRVPCRWDVQHTVQMGRAAYRADETC